MLYIVVYTHIVLFCCSYIECYRIDNAFKHNILKTLRKLSKLQKNLTEKTCRE